MFSQRPGTASGPRGIGAPASPSLCSAALPNPQPSSVALRPARAAAPTPVAPTPSAPTNISVTPPVAARPPHGLKPSLLPPSEARTERVPGPRRWDGGQERGWHRLANATTAGTRDWPRPQGTEVMGGSGHGHGARHHDQPTRGCSPTQRGSRSSHLAFLLLQAAPSHHIKRGGCRW